MEGKRHDVVIAGSGPAGAVAALTLARAGADVLLVDPGRFPRDKACGDVVGPRGVAALADLGVLPDAARPAGDVQLVGPDWRATRLPWPAHADGAGPMIVARTTLDGALRDAAVRAGAEPRTARVTGVAPGEAGVAVTLDDGQRLSAGFIIGADGAMSRVASAVGMLRPERSLWGFALRAYVPFVASAPHIVLWAPDGRRPLPGYGWLFPAGVGCANVGLGVAVGAQRTHAALAGRLLPAFVAALEARGMLERPAPLRPRRGGWMRMGLAGCSVAAGPVLLAGDAAALVNPLQGEGIAEAVTSGRAAAEAILSRPGDAAAAYRHALHDAFGAFQARAGALHALAINRPRLRSVAARGLTAPMPGRLAAPGWAAWWNDLARTTPPGRQRAAAAVIGAAASVATVAAPRRREVVRALTTGAKLA